MKKINLVILITILFFVLLLLIIIFYLEPTLSDIFTFASSYSIIIGLVFVYYQLKVNLNYSKRKSSSDFIFEQIIPYLGKLEIELRTIVGNKYLLFSNNESLMLYLANSDISDDDKNNVKKIVNRILNFYERMCICILKEVFDEDICYDDKGFNMISFYKWTIPYIQNIRREVNDERIYVNFEAISSKWIQRYNKNKTRIQKKKINQVDFLVIENKDIS